MVRVRLDIAYDGGPFRGLAPNEGVRTVVGDIATVLEPILGRRPEIDMAGRTDAGVHARHQVLSFDADPGVDTERLTQSINARLGPEVVATGARTVSDEFHARHSAIGRSYRYVVLNHPHPWPPTAAYEWWVRSALDIDAMNAAASALVGQHDFSSFCRAPKPGPGEPVASLVRRVDTAAWTEFTGDDLRRLRLEIAGPAFCHQMVRSIVGLCVAVGRGRRRAEEVSGVLAARDRNANPSPAPPHGLTLWQVTYPTD